MFVGKARRPPNRGATRIWSSQRCSCLIYKYLARLESPAGYKHSSLLL